MAHVYFPNHAPSSGHGVPAHSMSHSARRCLQDEQRARKAASMMQKPCEIILVRHGETAWNKEGRLQGQEEPGPPLDDLGHQQAAVAAQVLMERFPVVDAVISSDLLRAVQTAEVVAAGYQLQVQQHKGLRERNMGVLQGLTYTDAPHAQPEAWAAMQSDSTATKLPGGESLDELRERLTAAVMDVARTHAGQRVVVLSHGGALHSLHRAARGYQAKGKVFNCSISILLAEAEAEPSSSTSTSSSTQQQYQQQQEQPHLDRAHPSSLGLKAFECDADSLAVVWCDPTEMCDHCSSSEDSSHSHHSQQHGHTNSHADGSPADAAAAGGGAGVGSLSRNPSLDHSKEAVSSHAAAAAGRGSRSGSKGSGMKQCGGGSVKGGRLALLSWNDSYALQAAHLQSDKAFGGSSRAG